jgi:8-oxo-dGTP diphosphatase
MTFDGAKIILIHGDELVAYKRDDKPSIPHPGLWDLPGGGREGDETPVECALREVEEEFGIVLDAGAIHWVRRYPRPAGQDGYMLAAEITQEQIGAIVFGDEGERWEMMPIAVFLEHPKAVPSLKSRLADYLSEHPRSAPPS